jgi:hypothetical protein
MSYRARCLRPEQHVEAAAIERVMQPLQPVAAPIGHLGPVDLAVLPISTFEKGC